MSNKRNKQPSKEQLIQVIERTDKFFEKFCKSVVKGKAEEEKCLIWQGKFETNDTFLIIQAKLFQGCAGFIIGAFGGKMLYTDEVLEQHEQMMKDFEQILVQVAADNLASQVPNGDA